ncbi:daptide biosynthesis intramembrane metalloprotease [Streptomyces sp. NPDC052610]|uniref:daptide biosynthesis intramembrane metalloprotease n=1 Tax=Streptomyces sp. NPDC052610 TaxID=3154952 RepID=UPI0034229B4A
MRALQLLERRRSPAPAPADHLTRPRLAPDVRVHAPLATGAPWVVQRGSQQYLRVGADLARLLQVLDGERGHAGLVAELGPPWTEQAVGRAVASLGEKGLLDDGSRKRHSGTWFKFVPPLTFQLTLLKPERLLNALAPLVDRLANRAGAVVAAVLALGGLLALVAQGPALAGALGEPLPLAVLLGVSLGSTVTTALHEIGHGAVLTYYGGRPSRMGVMLFYLTPAFFCDVSDGWRLPHREQRVRVALAGIVTQAVVAGTVAFAALATGLAGGAPTLRAGLTVFAVSTYVTGVLNLLPFVKLDGYLALMSHLDTSHLRDRAMTDARRLVARVLFGGRRYERELPALRWAPAFGLACMVFPLYLIGLALTLWLDILTGLGVIGASVVLAALAYLGYRACKGASLLVREARKGGARIWRLLLAGAVAAAGLGAALAFVTVPYTITGGFVSEDGRTRLVLSDAADRAAVREGAAVTLQRRGLVLRTDLGTATVTGGAKLGTAPLSAFVPVREGDELPVPAYEVPLAFGGGTDDHAGLARVDAGERPLGEWLYLSYVAPVWR